MLAEANIQSTEMDDMGSIGARVFALTLTDDGMDGRSQPSKLWSSRNEFQLRASEHCAAGVSTPSVDDVTVGLARFTLSHGHQQPQPPEASNPPPDTLSTSGTHSSNSHTPCPSDRDHPSPPLAARSSSNGKHDRRTATAHTRLNAIESRLKALLSSEGNDASTLSSRHIREEAITLKEALNNVNRNEPLVQNRKKILLTAVEEITAQEVPSSPKSAIQYNCDHHYHRPVDRCDETAQVSIFLEVLCAVILGISRHASDLIMCLISLVLRLAFRDPANGRVSVLGEDIMAQIPATIQGALSRFSLQHRTTVFATCPSCSFIHKPILRPGSTTPKYPTHCHHKPKTWLPDVWDAEFLRSFEGPLPNTLFVDRQGEGRLVFSLNVDFFNVQGVRVRGRVVRSAVACVVCDLPAAQKIAQLASHSNYFYCNVCHCKDRKTLGRTDFHSDCWQLRDKDSMRCQAVTYKNTSSAAEQDKLFASNGVRWSPLWKLPYWDPAHQLVVDAMHCILEGITSFHVRDILSLTTVSADAPYVALPAFAQELRSSDPITSGMSATEVKQVKSIHVLLTSSVAEFDMEDDGQTQQIQTHIDLLTKRLMGKNIKALEFVANDLDLDCELTTKGRISKAKWVGALIEWRKGKPWAGGPQQARYGTREVMECVWSMIRTADTPSWLRSVPKDFGSPGAGSLKADEWRTIITVYLPLALVSLWGDGTTHKSRAIALQLREALDHTMALVAAVYIACARSMTREHAIAYRTYMGTWLSRLKTIHPSAPYRTNGHMAIHIHQFLLSFGPVCSWWCFPFERLIGQLQRLPTNDKFGQLESTILSCYIQSAQLKAWLARDECQTLFHKAFTPLEHEDTVDVSHAQLYPTPAELHALIPQRSVTLHANSTHIGNSLIAYHVGGNASLPAVPGSIKYIFGIDSKIYFAVQRQNAAPAETLSTTLERVEPAWVLAHYVRWRFAPGYVAILTLFRKWEVETSRINTPWKRTSQRAEALSSRKLMLGFSQTPFQFVKNKAAVVDILDCTKDGAHELGSVAVLLDEIFDTFELLCYFVHDIGVTNGQYRNLVTDLGDHWSAIMIKFEGSGYGISEGRTRMLSFFTFESLMDGWVFSESDQRVKMEILEGV
ncbi:hypothetical protein HD554DRAFT_2041166 [Boletus coccyginus]|nr:hypothetical protein HD554DRAFT_2041166 [Boletus coccyginus]